MIQTNQSHWNSVKRIAFALVLPLALSSILCGCAGPTTPFGALSPKSWFTRISPSSILGFDSAESNSLSYTSEEPLTAPRLRFFPRHQVVHDNFDFTVILEDPRGVDSEPRIQLSYNKIDVTKQFIFQTHTIRLSATKLKLVFSNLHLKADRNHGILVKYSKAGDLSWVASRYSPAPCTSIDNDPILSTGSYEVEQSLIQMIMQKSIENGVNPSFTAGLVAQESRFNPKAVSYKRALGLTQMTSLGEAQIIDSIEDWPRFPEINNIPAALLKMRILAGTINEKNEWRLEPSKSLQGGLTYFKHVREYWHKPINLESVKAHFPLTEQELTKLMLASYNAGPTRVHSALESLGTNWINHEELEGARKYVGRVLSFCSRFSQPESENE